ncbi:MAG TPA: type VII secretion protein EccB [Pseudonocardiaceae bacterium]|jgi:type VII secretion protein EccB|nr:type VII secretion protein EccB [Pseudonocardiaceae bacterium]
MQSRRDQIQAHTFVRERLAAGVLRIDPDGMDQPVARTSKATMIGVVLAAIGCVVVLLIGVVLPSVGGDGWRQSGALVIDSGTGAEYMYAGNALHPALNATSARLVAGSQLNVTTASDAALRGTPRGAPFGIVGAPDAPPAGDALSGAAWSACAYTLSGAASALPKPQLELSVGHAEPDSGLTIDQGILVSAPDDTEYLLWNGERLKLDAANGAPQALGYTALTPTPVTIGFLDAIPNGPDLAAPAITGLGGSGPELAGKPGRIGRLYSDDQGRDYLLTQAGLAPLTPTLFSLISEDPSVINQAYGTGVASVTPLTPEDLIAHSATSALATQRAQLPASPPKIVTVHPGQAACADLRPSSDAVDVSIGVATANAVTADATPQQTGTGVVASCRPADLVAVDPGTGALVTVEPAGGGGGTTYYLVADNGVKYPIPSGSVLGQLGYSAASAVSLPAPVVGLLATGPSLDPNELTNGGVIAPSSTPPQCLA